MRRMEKSLINLKEGEAPYMDGLPKSVDQSYVKI